MQLLESIIAKGINDDPQSELMAWANSQTVFRDTQEPGRFQLLQRLFSHIQILVEIFTAAAESSDLPPLMILFFSS